MENEAKSTTKKRTREIIWYNPPFNKNVKTKIGFHFINLIDKHFGDKGNKLNKIFNRNKIKISFSCMKNMGQIIKSHNAKMLSNKKQVNHPCNCQIKRDCPLNGKCMRENIVYLAQVSITENNQPTPAPIPDRPNPERYQLRNRNSETTNNNESNGNITQEIHRQSTQNTPRVSKEMFYIGAAENFKQRFRNHLKSFRHEAYKKETELSNYIWGLKSNNINHSIKFKILKQTSGYNKISKICNLCLAEKLEICKFKDKSNLLNKRNELVNKCRHENKYLLANLPDP